MTTTMSKARKRITLLLALLALLALSSSSSSLASAQEQQGDGFFDAAAAGDFEPDIAGEPLAPLAPAVIDEEEGEGPAAAPAPAPAVKKPAAARAPAPAPAAAAATKKKEEEPKPAAAAPAKKEAASSSNALPYADLLYTVLARRATFDPRSRKLTLEGVFPIVAAVKVGRGDGRGPTSLRGEGKDRDRECSALVAKTARRSSATWFFGDTFRRNGVFFFFFFFFFFEKLGRARAEEREGERERERKGSSHLLFSLLSFSNEKTLYSLKKKTIGTWLNSPTALLMGTDSSRAGAELALRLSDVQYRPSASTVVFRAEQIDPTTVVKESKAGEKSSSPSPLRSSGGVVESWAALAAGPGGKWLDPKGSKVVLQDVLLDVDAPYSRQEHQLKGFEEVKG